MNSIFIMKIFWLKISFLLMSAQWNLPTYRGPNIDYAVVRPFGVIGTHHHHHHHQGPVCFIFFIIWILYNPSGIHITPNHSPPTVFSKCWPYWNLWNLLKYFISWLVGLVLSANSYKTFICALVDGRGWKILFKLRYVYWNGWVSVSPDWLQIPEFRRQTDRTVCLLCNLVWTELTF